MFKVLRSLFLSLCTIALTSCGGSEPGQSTALTAASTTVKPSSSPQWRVVDIGALTGSESSAATGINASGDVVGAGYQDASGASPGFLYRNGKVSGLSFYPYGINKYGSIIGTNGSAAVVLENGQLRTLGTLGGNYASGSVPRAINDKGQIVGYSYGGGDFTNVRAFLYSDGRMQDIGTLDADPVSVALAINKRGQIVGYTFNPSTAKQRGFLYQNGQMIDLSPMGIDSANGINDDGVIVGSNIIYESSTGKISTIPPYFEAYDINNRGVVSGVGFGGAAYVYQNGVKIDLNNLQSPDYWVGLFATTGINDEGKIIGTARASSDGTFGNITRAFVLVPVK
jgi:probable HAF family extracellular repeat protein